MNIILYLIFSVQDSTQYHHIEEEEEKPKNGIKS